MEPNEQEIAHLKGEVADLRRRVEWLELLTQIQRPVSVPAPPVTAPKQELKPPSSGAPLVPGAAQPPAPASPVPPAQPAGQGSVAAPTIPAPPARKDGPSLESRIGGQILNRIGIVALLIGVSWFLKLAIENQSIGPAGQVAIGLVAGIGVVFWSEVFRRRGYKIFSYSLKAVGVGSMYLSLWAAVQVHHLIPAWVGFAAMLAVTAATAAMAVAQNAQVLAAYAIAGGFSSPVLVSTGENHQVFLFSYVTLLNVGVLALIALRGWRRLIAGSFLGTLILYVGWYASYYTEQQLVTTLVFATVFFASFAANSLIPRGRETRDGAVLAILVALAAAGLYFLTLYGMLEAKHYDMLAWIAIALAAVYVLLARQIAAQKDAETRRVLNLLHLAIAVGFLTAAVPLKLRGHWITIGWLVESAALLYVAQRAKHGFLKVLGCTALAIGIVRMLVAHWPTEQQLIFNPRFGTYAVALAVIGAIVYGWRTSTTAGERKGRIVAAIIFNVLALVALHFEVHDAFIRELAATGANYARYREIATARDFTHSAVWMAYGALLMWAGFMRRSALLRWQAIVLLGLTVGKVFLFDVWGLERIYRVASFMILGVILLAVSFLYQKKLIVLSGKDRAA